MTGRIRATELWPIRVRSILVGLEKRFLDISIARVSLLGVGDSSVAAGKEAAFRRAIENPYLKRVNADL